MSKMIQKLLTWITGVLEMVFFAGVFYGWANIYPVLEDEGYFTESCPDHANYTTTPVSTTCKHQVESLALVFTISGAVGLFANFFTGALLDRCGMWVTRTVLIILSVFAYILVAISTVSTSFLLYLAFPIISGTGFGIFVITTQMTNLYPKFRGSYSFSLFGGFSSASTVYLIFNKLYYSGIDLKRIIYGYIGICLLMNIRTFLLTPKRSIPYTLPPNYKYGYKELCSEGTAPVVESKFERENNESVTDKNFNPDNMTFKQCLCKVHTYTAILNYTVMHFVSTFYMSSLSMFLKSFLGFTEKEDIVYYVNMFGIIQCSSIVLAPLNGFLIDYCRRKFAKNTNDRAASIKACAIGFSLGNIFLMIMISFCLIPSAKCQIVAMIMQVLSRICFYGVFTMFLCMVYPTKHYGKMFGFSTCVVGVSMLLQYPLTLILTRVINENFTILNGFFLALACIAWVNPLYIWYYVYPRTERSNRESSKEIHLNAVSLNDET